MRCEDLVDHGGTRLEVVEEQFTTRGTAATADGNRQIKFHTEGHLLIRWGRGEALCDSPHSAQYTVVNLEGLSTLYTLILRLVCSLERVLVNFFIGSVLNSLQRLRYKCFAIECQTGTLDTLTNVTGRRVGIYS